MKYDLHVHSNFSKCSNLSPEAILRAAKKRGLDGVAITDHDTISGALEVKKLNKDKDFEVIVGEEVTAGRNHILCYYVKEEIRPGSVKEVLSQARKQGCIVVFAHPFDFLRRNFGMKGQHALADAVECQNSRSLIPLVNSFTRRFCKKRKVAMVGGSDAHFGFEVGRSCTVFEGDLRKAVSSKKTNVRGTSVFGYPGIAATAARKIRRLFL